MHALQFCPLPISPRYIIFLPKHSNKLYIESKSFLSPPTIIDKVAFFAPISPPETGASKTLNFLPKLYIFLANKGDEVVISIKYVPSFAYLNMPSSPKYTSSTSFGYPTIVNTTSAFSTHSLIVLVTVIPNSFKGSHLESVLLNT